MGKLSDYAATDMLIGRFSRDEDGPPATYYLGLSTTTPTNAGNNISEPAGASYERLALDNDTTTFESLTSRTVTNAITLEFVQALESWGLCTHFVLFDSPTTGDFHGWGALTPALNVVATDTVTFDPGDLVITSPGT